MKNQDVGVLMEGMKMRLFDHQQRRDLMLTVLCPLLLALSGCAMVGPRSISMGRADYNEAVDRTENEQMLLSIVKGRYGDTFDDIRSTIIDPGRE